MITTTQKNAFKGVETVQTHRLRGAPCVFVSCLADFEVLRGVETVSGRTTPNAVVLRALQVCAVFRGVSHRKPLHTCLVSSEFAHATVLRGEGPAGPSLYKEARPPCGLPRHSYIVPKCRRYGYLSGAVRLKRQVPTSEAVCDMYGFVCSGRGLATSRVMCVDVRRGSVEGGGLVVGGEAVRPLFAVTNQQNKVSILVNPQFSHTPPVAVSVPEQGRQKCEKTSEMLRELHNPHVSGQGPARQLPFKNGANCA